LWWLYICHGASMMTIRIRAATISPQHSATNDMPYVRASEGVAWVSANISSRYELMTMAATVPITQAFKSVLNSSTNVWAENMRPIPLMGFMRSNFGCSALPDNTSPPSSTDARMATTTSTPNSGSRVSSARYAKLAADNSMTVVSRPTFGSNHMEWWMIRLRL